MDVNKPNIAYKSNHLLEERCAEIYAELKSYPFEHSTLTIRGCKYTPLRKVCTYADSNVNYSYSGSTPITHPWTPLLLELKSDLEKELNCVFNYMLANYYESGEAKIGQHKDSESSLDASVPIATLSFGATRTMTFTHKGKKSFHQPLENGSLLIMYDQQWTHAINPNMKIREPRISLTFRKIHAFPIPTVPFYHSQEITLPTKPKKRTQSSDPTNTFSKKKCLKSSVSILKPSEGTSLHTDPSSILEKCVEQTNSVMASYVRLAVPTDLTPTLYTDSIPKPSMPTHPYDMDKDIKNVLDDRCVGHDIIPKDIPPKPLEKVDDKYPEYDWLDAFYEEIQQQNVKPVLDTRDLKKFWLNEFSAISIQLRNSEVFVHITEYHQNKDTWEYLPTEKRVCLNLDCYYDFSRKIFNFGNSLNYSGDSTIIGNCLLAVVEDRKLRLQTFTKTNIQSTYILLDIRQLQTLREIIHEVDNTILNFLYVDQLRSLVSVEKPYSIMVKDVGLRYLKTLIESNLMIKISTLYLCRGCYFSTDAKGFHDCETMSDIYKYESLNPSVRMLCDVQSVAKTFLADHTKLNASASDFIDTYNNLFS